MSSRLKKRSVFLSEVLLFFSQASMEIEYVNLPVPDILRKIEAGCCCRSLDFISPCLESLNLGYGFCDSWEQSVENSSLPMKKEERQRLKNLGSLLGTSDAVGQRSILALYTKYFTYYHELAVADYEKYGKMCVTVSLVTGVGIFILLM